MTRKPSKPVDAAAIAESEKRGWTAVKVNEQPRAAYANFAADNADQHRGDVVLPSTQALRRKYLGAAADDVVERAWSLDSASAEQTQIVELQSGGLRKSVGVRNGKVVWQQG